ncbi:MAG TPA: alpha/beta hydrolase [Ktedonobacteraceae bacterium]|nr:alpha/beta hydrolase [Ktedonobacteraceae bacterium]
MARTPASQRIITAFLIISGALAILYVGVSISLAFILACRPPIPITTTPSSLGLSYRDVTFLSRQDHLLLRGWLIPGILPDGRLTVERTIIQVHGANNNRAMVLDICAVLARHGIAVLAYDSRGNGESTPAPSGGGYFEERDVLGAVDYLRSGPLPYPELGRPRAIGGWGISIGGDALIFAAAKEPAIKAIVVDSAYATLAEYMQHAFGPFFIFIPGTRLTSMMLYGLDYATVRPVDVIARIAPRPILLIHGADDTDILPSNMVELDAAASAQPGADVQTWLVPHAKHIQAYYVDRNTYIDRLITFFQTELST